jgi:Kef-type K+ transport system membrane component KefB
MELEFGVATELFIVMLFVTMGVTITLSGLSTIGPLVLVLILAHYLATATGIFAFARPARLRWKQAGLLSLGMLPMSVASTGFAQISGATPQTAAAIAPVLAGTLIVLELFGPVIAQFALIKSGERGCE